MIKIFIISICINFLCFGSLYSQNQWNHVFPQLTQLKIATTENGNIFGISNNMELYKSETGDQGSWSTVIGFPLVNTYKLFASENTVFLLNQGSNYNGLGIYASDDMGSTWETRNSGLVSDHNVINMFEMKNNVLLIQTNPAENVYNFYRSTNSGTSWEFIQSIENKCFSLALSKESDSLAYLAAGSTVYKSTNNGLYWQEINISAPDSIFNIIFDDDESHLIASGHERIMGSTDDGSMWNTIATQGLPDLTIFSILSFVKLHDETTYIALWNEGGVFYSDNNAIGWTEITSNLNSSHIYSNNFAIDEDGYLYSSPSLSGVYKSAKPVIDSATGIESFSNLDAEIVSVYPNPASNEVFISSKVGNIYKVDILNIKGEVILSRVVSSQNTSIDLQGYRNGLYFLNIQTSSGTMVSKINVH